MLQVGHFLKLSNVKNNGVAPNVIKHFVVTQKWFASPAKKIR